MAVFLVNTCKFNGCGLTFATLTELIRHIEDTHLDFDPRAIEKYELQQPSCLPISYILRVFTESSRKETIALSANQTVKKLTRPHSPSLSLSSTTPTGSEMDEIESDSRDSSVDSWPNINAADNHSANAILKIMSPQTASNNSNSEDKDRPFLCAISGCKKRYRNANGLKNHNKSAHNNTANAVNAIKKELNGSTKVYKCECGKIYKTSHGLKNHNNAHHSQQQSLPPMSSDKSVTSAANPVTTASKESILATFVRMKTFPCNTSSASVIPINQNGIETVPLMLTLQTENESTNEKANDSNLVANNKTVVRKCPIIAAPTLQQHLLSPISAKSTINLTKIL